MLAYRFVVDISMTIPWFQDNLLNIQGIGLTPEAPYCHLQVQQLHSCLDTSPVSILVLKILVN